MPGQTTYQDEVMKGQKIGADTQPVKIRNQSSETSQEKKPSIRYKNPKKQETVKTKANIKGNSSM